MEAVERFTDLVRRQGGPPALDAPCAWLAKALDPTAPPVGETLARLDDLAARVGDPTFDAVVELLFDSLDFRGPVGSYGVPEHSLLPSVLERRRGLPILLGVVAMEVGRRLGVRIDGIGMPGHFLIGDAQVAGRYVDAFGSGERLDRAGCIDVFRRIHGLAVAWDDRYLAPTGNASILARVLANLEVGFARGGDRRGWAMTVRLRAAVPSVPPADRLRLADALAGSGRYDWAAEVCESIALDVPHRSDELAARAIGLRARLN